MCEVKHKVKESCHLKLYEVQNIVDFQAASDHIPTASFSAATSPTSVPYPSNHSAAHGAGAENAYSHVVQILCE
jgi:hypothetical protein